MSTSAVQNFIMYMLEIKLTKSNSITYKYIRKFFEPNFLKIGDFGKNLAIKI